MKITQIAVFTSLMALSFNASAAGAKKPVTEFEGAYRLSAGTTYENQNGRDVACPESLTLDAEEVRNAKGKLVNATLKAASSSGTVMSFTKVNLGSTWLGGVTSIVPSPIKIPSLPKLVANGWIQEHPDNLDFLADTPAAVPNSVARFSTAMVSSKVATLSSSGPRVPKTLAFTTPRVPSNSTNT